MCAAIPEAQKRDQAGTIDRRAEPVRILGLNRTTLLNQNRRPKPATAFCRAAGFAPFWLVLLLAGCNLAGASGSPTATSGPAATFPAATQLPTLAATASSTAAASHTQPPTTPTSAATNSTTGATRISFGPGGTGAEVEDTLAVGSTKRYVLRALGGQIMRVYLEPYGIELRIHGADGALLDDVERYDPYWRGALPSSQDYVFELVHSPPEQVPTAISYQLSIVIVPPGQSTLPIEYGDLANGFRLTYSDYFVEGPPPGIYDLSGESVLLSLIFAGTEFFRSTNLAEVSLVVSAHNLVPGEACAFPAIGGPEISADSVEVGGMTYLRRHTGGIAAGNYYELISHSTGHGDRCFSVTFYIHSTSLGANPPGVVEFDRAGIEQHLTGVLASFRFIDN